MKNICNPKVLLIGNGFNLLVNNNASNNEIVETFLRTQNSTIDDKDVERIAKEVPFSLLNMLSINNGEKTKTNTIREAKFDEKLLKAKYNDNPLLKELLNIGFDAILTTNFTYECETALDKYFEKIIYKSIKTNNITNGKPRKETKYFLKTFNQVIKNNNTYNIWHIHGELRNTNSLVYGLPDYNGLITKIFNYISQKKKTNKHESKIYESWIDYFLYGDMFVVGNSLSFFEYDLWQLLYTKSHIKNRGNTVFYEQKEKDNYTKHLILKELGVDVRDFAIEKRGEEFDYNSFYKKAIKDIEKYFNI